MKHTLAAALAAVAVVAGGVFAATPASALPAHIEVVGGEQAPTTSWAVQLEASGGTIPSGYVSNCTGSRSTPRGSSPRGTASTASVR